jgi:hypothetical protein
MGPVCRARQRLQGELGLDNHAVFRIEDEKEDYIFIRDCGNNHNCKTITNDIEWVLEELESLCDIEDKRIFYMDSLGSIDEVLHKGKIFVDFRAGCKRVKL